jgi:hypothetical protein
MKSKPMRELRRRPAIIYKARPNGITAINSKILRSSIWFCAAVLLLQRRGLPCNASAFSRPAAQRR